MGRFPGQAGLGLAGESGFPEIQAVLPLLGSLCNRLLDWTVLRDRPARGLRWGWISGNPKRNEIVALIAGVLCGRRMKSQLLLRECFWRQEPKKQNLQDLPREMLAQGYDNKRAQIGTSSLRRGDTLDFVKASVSPRRGGRVTVGGCHQLIISNNSS